VCVGNHQFSAIHCVAWVMRSMRTMSHFSCALVYMRVYEQADVPIVLNLNFKSGQPRTLAYRVKERRVIQIAGNISNGPHDKRIRLFSESLESYQKFCRAKGGLGCAKVNI
jgi:hypothetical protein